MKANLVAGAFFALSAPAIAHNAAHLDTHQKRSLHKARSQCSKDLHCLLTHEATEGPFYVPEPLIRSNITEDRPGAPLKLRLQVVDVNQCAPAAGSYIDIWHADASGEYSGWAKETSFDSFVSPRLVTDVTKRDDRGPPSGPPSGPPNFGHPPPYDSRWLRGVVKADESGTAEFETIMPAWYRGRTTHIHLRVHSGNVTIEDGHLTGAGRVAHTGQLYFADKFVTELAGTRHPYIEHAERLKPTLNEDDGIYMHSDGAEQVVKMEADGDGFVGFVTVGVDPTADRKEDGPRGPGGKPPGCLWVAFLVMFVVVAVAGAGCILVRRWRSEREGAVALPTDERHGSREPLAAYRDEDDE